MRQQTFAAVDLNTTANQRIVNSFLPGQTRGFTGSFPNSYDYNAGHKAGTPEYNDEN